MIKTILITGGTGLVGKQVVNLLLEKGYKIHLLVRKNKNGLASPNLSVFQWDVFKRQIDPKCVAGVDAIIHLAGESIAGQRWTSKRKSQILSSRTESIRMIYNLMRSTDHQVRHVVSASAVGYYGDRGDAVLTEESAASADFLAETCVAWEKAVDEGKQDGLRIVKLRSGIVLDAEGGILQQLLAPLKFGLGIVPGNGKQWLPWIHIKDASAIYAFALENEGMEGVYNMAAPSPVRMQEMMRVIARTANRSPLILTIPEFALKITMGEMSLIALESSRVSADKLMKTGYVFNYPSLQNAIREIFKNR